MAKAKVKAKRTAKNPLISNIPASNTTEYQSNEYEGKDYCSKLIDFYSSVSDHIDDVSTMWSVFEVRDFTAIAFKGKYELYYDGGWGKEQSCDVENPTWLQIWQAANKLIKQSGDGHHIFIEQVIWGPKRLTIETGS